jgi:hypothetical protein
LPAVAVPVERFLRLSAWIEAAGAKGPGSNFQPATSSTGYHLHAISFSPRQRYLKSALPRSTGKKAKK